MRAVILPLLVVLTIVLGGLGLAEGSRFTGDSFDDVPPLIPRVCQKCGLIQSVESDWSAWGCQRCRTFHWRDSGISPVEPELEAGPDLEYEPQYGTADRSPHVAADADTLPPAGL